MDDQIDDGFDDEIERVDDKRAKQTYKDGWSESNWSEDMEKHPFFMTSAPESDSQFAPLVEALSQLKYDAQFNSKSELAMNYKEDGNVNFSKKKYRWAVDSYSEGIAQKCDDRLLNSTLFANRSAAHFRLANYRSALNDALKALQLNEHNQKALIRIAMCYYELKEYAKCVDTCGRHRSLGIEVLLEYEKKANIELKKFERNSRKEKLEIKRREIMRQNIIKAVDDRKIKYKSVKSLLESEHGAADGRHVVIDESGRLVWPVLFIYPEYGQTDFIESFNENDTFRDQLNAMFEELADWDVHQKYRPHNMKIAYKSLVNNEVIFINSDQKLKEILSEDNFILSSSIPTFFITCGEINIKL